MNKIILVAKREYRQITRMRSFWLTLLILPLAFAIAPLAQRFMDEDGGDRVMLVDQGDGASARAVGERLNLEEQRRILNELSRYVQKHKLQSDPAALWAQHDRWYGDAEVARFAEEGGVTAALTRLRPGIPEGTPEFEAPDQYYELVPASAELSRLQGTQLDEKVEALLRPADEKVERIDYVVLIPGDFAQTGVVRLWTGGRPSAAFVNTVQEVLTRSLRQALLVERGVAPGVAAAASTVTPSLLVSQPPPGGGAKEALFVRSILPLASSYLLMMALMLSGSWMLQGTVEERSNKLLETVLAAVSPEELMYGKLLGTVGVGLTMIAVWIGCGIVAAYATQGAIADMIRPALAPLTSAGTIAAMIYFFVVGYVAISVFFLAVGVISDSMNDAQGYLMPIILAIVLPITILIQGIMEGGQGLGITLLTWIPIWTPFAVLARLGTGIPAWEVIGSGLVLAAFVAVELVLLGRLFRMSLLAQGQKPGVAELFARMKRQRA
ncbi:MAG: ABC transporter permease [Pseudomonadota bacterium]|nr:ABC transporter permease [Pseudomonadota bacterium]